MPIAPQITNTPVDLVYFEITAVAYTSTTATYTAAGHTYAVGDTVAVSGLSPDGYNGTFTVTAVTTNTFTVANTTNATVTVATGDSYGSTADSTFESSYTPLVYKTDTEDLADPDVNPALAQAQQAINDAATAIANAAAANAAATSAAYAAGVAQSTANGKNTAHYSTSGPSGGGTAGDLWFQVNSGGTVLYQYAYNGSSWISAPISNTVIANLDAGKINAGTITGIAYNNGSGTFSVSPSGVLVASSATITGAVYATSGTFTGTVTATSGSFTGTVNSSAGSIGGWTLSGSQLYSGTGAFMNASTGNIGGNTITAFSDINCYGLIYTSGNMDAAGSITAEGQLYAQQAISASTSAATNCYITSAGSIRKTSTTSSLRYKENITPIVDVADIDPRKLLDIPVIGFVYKADHIPATDQRAGKMLPGFIAEDVANIYPIAADYEGELVETWNERFIVPGLLALIQDQEKRIKALEGK